MDFYWKRPEVRTSPSWTEELTVTLVVSDDIHVRMRLFMLCLCLCLCDSGTKRHAKSEQKDTVDEGL